MEKLHRKSFISVGVFSFVLLSIWGLWKIAELYIEKTKPEHNMWLNLCCPDSTEINDPTVYNISTKRHYKTFQLTSSTLLNKPILELATKTLNSIKKNKDTINGIHIILNDSTKYSDFIKALANCGEKFPQIYAPYKNHIWAFYVHIDTTSYPKVVLDRMRRKGLFNFD